jgi:putative transposase
MGRPPRLHLPRAFFHVTQRGNNRRPIFLDDQDRRRYLGVLVRAMEDGEERLHGYCLMSNHTHLLIQAGARPISLLMQRLGTAHARCFNDRWVRSGHLFQGRFHASFVPADPRLLVVLRYVHLNPVRAGLVEDPSHHFWSSHRAYLGYEAPSWLCTRDILGLLHHDETRARLAYSALMGQQDEAVPELACEGDAPPTDAPVLDHGRGIGDRIPVEEVLREVARESGLSVDEIRGGRGGHRLAAARYAVAFLARSFSRSSSAELARLLGRDATTLHNGVTRRLRLPTPAWTRLIEGVRLSLSEKGRRKA